MFFAALKRRSSTSLHAIRYSPRAGTRSPRAGTRSALLGFPQQV